MGVVAQSRNTNEQIVRSIVFWDPVLGSTKSGHTNFLKIGYFKY